MELKSGEGLSFISLVVRSMSLTVETAHPVLWLRFQVPTALRTLAYNMTCTRILLRLTKPPDQRYGGDKELWLD